MGPSFGSTECLRTFVSSVVNIKIVHACNACSMSDCFIRLAYVDIINYRPRPESKFSKQKTSFLSKKIDIPVFAGDGSELLGGDVNLS